MRVRTKVAPLLLAGAALLLSAATAPGAEQTFSPLGRFVLDGSSLPPREREIVMLRMGWLCQSEYEWAQHARIGKAQAGLSNADVHRIAEGPTAAGWSDFERTLLRMVDELRRAPHRDRLHDRRLHDDRARDQQPGDPARTRISLVPLR